MVTVTFEDVYCRRVQEQISRYRIVLFSAGHREELVKSSYSRGSNVFGWINPFKDPIMLSGSDIPSRLTIELREKGWLGRSGRVVCSYNLVLACDCESSTFTLRTDDSRIAYPPEISVTITVVGIHPLGGESRSAIEPDAAKPHRPVVGGQSGLIGLVQPTAASAITSTSPTTLSASNRTLLTAALNTVDDTSRERSFIGRRRGSIMASTTAALPPSVGAYASLAWSGVAYLSAVIEAVDFTADIHAAVRGAWTLLNVAYTMAHQQKDLDPSIIGLVNVVDANCEILRALVTVDLVQDATLNIMRRILREVLKGASLIKHYCLVQRSKTSLSKSIGPRVQLDACLQTLEDFRRDFADHLAAGSSSDLYTLDATLAQSARWANMKYGRIDDFVLTADIALLDQMMFAPTADHPIHDESRGCLPGTRVEIIDSIVNWAIGAVYEDSTPYIPALNVNSRVLWLCGVAGSGKSSIAISVARAVRSMDRLGALYVFDAAFQTSLNPTNLFSTIARQRAARRPAQERHLLNALGRMDPDQRITPSASEQFKNFISSSAPEFSNALDDVIVIDAFDESGSVPQRAAALLALSPDVQSTAFPSDVRIIVTSRYDVDVARRLESVTAGNAPLCSVLRMEDIHSGHTERDIERYVSHMLGEVYGLEASRAAGDLARLAVTAEHSFQWASTACRYVIDSDDHDGARLPHERLQETLETRGGLDGLYLSVLNQSFAASMTRESPATRSLRMILGTLVCAFEPVSIHIIAGLASADQSVSTVDLAGFHVLTRKLSSIVTGTEDLTTPLVAFHNSFTDFLADAQRSQRYAVDFAEVHLHLALGSLAVMRKLLRFNICNLESSFMRNNAVPVLPERIKKHIPDELSYACRFWPAHVAAAFSRESAGTQALQTSFSTFLENKLLLLEWLEVMSLTGVNASESLGPLLSLKTESRDLSNLITFTTYFAVPISTSVPHIYLSALAFAPTSSLIIAPVSSHFPNLVHTHPPLLSWPRARHNFMHQSEVNCVLFHPNGRWVVSGAGSGEISVWDVYSGSAMLPRMSASGAVKSIAISRDGSLLASGSEDGVIQLWDMRTLSAVGEPVKAHSHWVWSVTFSPDGKLLASSSSDNTICLWDLQSSLAVQRASATHKDFILSLAFSPDGELLASGSRDGLVRLWDVPTLLPIGEPLGGHSDWVASVIFSPDGALLVSGSYDKTIRFWDVHTQSAFGVSLPAHDDYVRSVAFSPDGRTLVSCSSDKTVRLWDVESRSSVGEPLFGHTGAILSIAVSPDGSLIASSSGDSTVCVWDARVSFTERETPATPFQIQHFAASSPDGQLLASGSDGDVIQLWDVRSVSTIGGPLFGHAAAIRSVIFSPDGTLLASGSDDNTVRLWDVRTASAAGELLDGHSGFIQAVAFSPDSKLLASASFDKTVRLWDVDARSASGEPLTGHSKYASTVAFSPDGFTLASGDADGTVRFWDVQTHSLIGQALKGHSDSVRCVTFSPDGMHLASGSNDKTVRIWDVTTQSAVGKPLKGYTGNGISLAFSPNGALLASSSSSEDVVRVWDVRVLSEVGEDAALLRHETDVLSIAFLSDSPLLSSITSGGVVRRWDLGSLLSTWRTNLVGRPEDPPPKLSSSLLPHHPDLLGLPPDFLKVLDDGWVVGPNMELILWVPPAVRPSLSNLLEIERFGGPHLAMLDFADFVCGSDWTKCYFPGVGPVPNS